MRRANIDIAIAYPITPQSESMQQAGYLYDEGYIKEYYRAEEEIGTFSAISGASRAGVRSLTATSGPGLMRGMEAISSWPGARTPIIMLNMCRVINTPLAIQPDNIEMSFMLNTGILMMHAENQQDFYDYPLAAIMASEQVDVTLPAVVSVDGFFCTHARGPVKVTPEEYKLPPRDGWRSAVPAMDNENPPARISRDAPIQKSNFISYHMHSSWQQEVFAAVQRSAKYFRAYLGGLVEVINPGAEDFIIASGCAVSQARKPCGKKATRREKSALLKLKRFAHFQQKKYTRPLKVPKGFLFPSLIKRVGYTKKFAPFFMDAQKE
ncbi:MAG: ferredoxin oxidoreductase [Nitrospinota bacterium]|nr:MAG: ferredoxin oxidoreductase [Nitrospinota bacterium]